MKDKTYAYLAGIMDGEGTLTIMRKRYNPAQFARDIARGKRNVIPKTESIYSYYVGITVKNTDFRLIRWLQARFGGSYCPDKSRKANWKISYRWQLFGQENQERFLLGILPYIILKEEQANILLEFIRMRGSPDVKRRQGMYERMMVLNRRGVSPETNTPNTSTEVKIESELHSDMQSAPLVTANA